MLERNQVVPNIYESGYQEGRRSIVAQANARYQENLNPWQEFHWNALIDRKVYLGDKRNLRSYIGGENYQNNKFNFNATMPVINMICGRQMQHRKASQILPVHGSSDKTASQATKALQSSYYIDDTYNTVSRCFKESTITGLSLMHSWIDYRKDPICGDLRTECLSADMVMMDPFWREQDLSDCLDIRTRKYLHESMVKKLIPGREKDVDLLNSRNYYDTRFTFMPQQYNIRRVDYLAYDEYWYQAKRRATFVVDPETYESVEVNFSKEEMEQIQYQFPNIVLVKEDVPTVHLAIIVNDVCMYDGANPMGIDLYPYNPCVAYHDLADDNYSYRYQGAVRNIRDQDYLWGYRMQLEMDLLAAQFSGVDVEEDALIDDQDAFKVGPGKVRFFKKGRMLSSIRDVPGANINPANFEVTSRLKQGIQSDAGVTPELLGQAQDSDVGITEQLRQGAALTTLQELFDNVDLFQRNAARLHWAMIQENYTFGKIRKMIQEEPTDEFRNKSFQKYDAVVTNAPLTATTKQLSFLQKHSLWKDGLPIPVSDLLSDLVIQDKDKMIAAIEQEQQAQQQQAQMASQLQMENQQIVNESLQSKSISDRALAEERIRRGNLEVVEIETAYNKSKHELASATLDQVKAIKEVESMKIDDVAKIMQLIENIQKRQDENSLKQEALHEQQL